MEVEDEGGFGVDGRQLKIWETSSGPARTPLAAGITSSSPNTRVSLQHAMRCNATESPWLGISHRRADSAGTPAAAMTLVFAPVHYPVRLERTMEPPHPAAPATSS
jgi:hypothetical protein